jgi:nicotinamidase-related amidase
MLEKFSIQHSALLVLDMQGLFVSVMRKPRTLQARVQFAVSAANLLECPIVFTEQAPEKLGPTLPDITAAADLSVTLPKKEFSAFGVPSFEAHLKGKKVKWLLIAGLETPVCVLQTALDAVRHGFHPVLLEDCLGARRREDAKTVLTYLRTLHGVTILPSESIFYLALETSAHPQFRRYTQLVKAASTA